jgi:hypothetical protein
MPHSFNSKAGKTGVVGRSYRETASDDELDGDDELGTWEEEADINLVPDAAQMALLDALSSRTFGTIAQKTNQLKAFADFRTLVIFRVPLGAMPPAVVQAVLDRAAKPTGNAKEVAQLMLDVANLPVTPPKPHQVRTDEMWSSLNVFVQLVSKAGAKVRAHHRPPPASTSVHPFCRRRARSLQHPRSARHRHCAWTRAPSSAPSHCLTLTPPPHRAPPSHAPRALTRRSKRTRPRSRRTAPSCSHWRHRTAPSSARCRRR